MFGLRNKKIRFSIHTLNLSPAWSLISKTGFLRISIYLCFSQNRDFLQSKVQCTKLPVLVSGIGRFVSLYNLGFSALL